MSYRLGPEESLAAGLRRSACEQLDLAGLDRLDARFADEIDRHRSAPDATARGGVFAERTKALAARQRDYRRSRRSEAEDDRWADVA